MHDRVKEKVLATWVAGSAVVDRITVKAEG
jgi:hypothetical protein